MSKCSNEDCFELSSKILSNVGGKLYLNGEPFNRKLIQPNQQIIMKLNNLVSEIFRDVTDPHNYLCYHQKYFSGAWVSIEMRLVDNCK